MPRTPAGFLVLPSLLRLCVAAVALGTAGAAAAAGALPRAGGASLSAGGAALDGAVQPTSAPTTAPAPRPNIVLILADDLGCQEVGYNGGAVPTPNIDRLAADGVRLSCFYSAHLCTPARCELLTGRYAIRTGINDRNFHPWSGVGLPESERTLARALKQAGYSTAICGKWHLGFAKDAYLPQNRGFDHQYGTYLGTIDYWKHTHTRFGGLDWHRDGQDLIEEGYATDLIAADAARVILEHDNNRPLFLYVPFTAVHSPYQAPPELLARYAQIEDPQQRACAAMISSLDAGVGVILSALTTHGIANDTLVIFCSDNGPPLSLPNSETSFRGHKGSVYEGGLRVPVVVRWPGHLPAGAEREQMMHMIDWFPTLVRLAGGSPDAGPPLDGRDIWNTLASGAPSPHDHLLLALGRQEGALRRGPWKLVAYFEPQKAHELFDLSKDPRETTDVAAANPKIAEAMLAELEAYRAQAAPPIHQQDRVTRHFHPLKVWRPQEPKPVAP